MSTRTQLQSLGSNNAHPVSDRKKEIDDLICKLVDLLSESEECIDPLEEVGLQKIMLDRNIGESRYLIIRMPVMESPRILLSPREQEIVQMVAHGHPTKVIAGILNISCWTVSAHLRRIFIKEKLEKIDVVVQKIRDQIVWIPFLLRRQQPAPFRQPQLHNSLVRLLAIGVEIVPLLPDAKHRQKQKAQVNGPGWQP